MLPFFTEEQYVGQAALRRCPRARTGFTDGQEQASGGGRLTPLGVEAVAELERLGVVIDVSHLAEAAFSHRCEVSTRPFVASHSSCRALVDDPRNLTDDQLDPLAARLASDVAAAVADRNAVRVPREVLR